MQKDSCGLYLTEAKEEKQYWNIPIANSTVILLGTGTFLPSTSGGLLTDLALLLSPCMLKVTVNPRFLLE